MRFTKPALSFEDQLDRLVSRGLVVRDRELSIHYLSHINYYRIRILTIAHPKILFQYRMCVRV